jgi:hypothetical protein
MDMFAGRKSSFSRGSSAAVSLEALKQIFTGGFPKL